MKNDAYLKELHVGEMIRAIALQKNISTRKIADAICRYEINAAKIFNKADMEIEDVIQISDVLEFNLLEAIAQKYLSHFSITEFERESHIIKFNRHTQHYSIQGNAGNREFLDGIHIGEHIKTIAEQKGWTQHDMGKRLGLRQSNISRLYQSERINVKKLLRISMALERNLITEIYLSRMCIVPARYKLDACIITVNEQKVRIENPDDATFLMEFRRYFYEKQYELT